MRKNKTHRFNHYNSWKRAQNVKVTIRTIDIKWKVVFRVFKRNRSVSWRLFRFVNCSARCLRMSDDVGQYRAMSGVVGRFKIWMVKRGSAAANLLVNIHGVLSRTERKVSYRERYLFFNSYGIRISRFFICDGFA